ncbi:MAG: SGNH/GDSL hydrolase family protein [Candidatus Poribacteria bacterium]|nr:SGNH/GDSL hydrolase family protein [Candidatus Poribacteria bacterium]
MNPFTIVAFGDSITHAADKADNQKWTHLLEQRLEKDGHACSVVNSGIGGHTTAQGLSRIDADVFAHHPNVVVIEFGFNDCNIVEGGNPRTKLDTFRENQIRIGESVREKTGAKIAYIANHPTLIFDVRANGHSYEWNSRRYNVVTREIAAQLDAPLLDLHALYGRNGVPLGSLLSQDKIHLSQAGEVEYAQLVGDFLIEREMI